MKNSGIGAAVAAAVGLAIASPAMAVSLVIDDWDLDAGSGVDIEDTDAAAAVFVQQGRTATGGVSLTRGDFYANLLGPRGATTTGDCDLCKAGTFSNDVGSLGHGYWQWLGGGDLSGYDSVDFEYSADLAAADVIVSFWSAGSLVASVQRSDLPSTGGDFQTFSLALPDGLTGIDEIYLDVFSVGGAFTDPTGRLGDLELGQGRDAVDFRIRSLTLETVPEPGSLALIGLGLLGLGAARRRS